MTQHAEVIKLLQDEIRTLNYMSTPTKNVVTEHFAKENIAKAVKIHAAIDALREALQPQSALAQSILAENDRVLRESNEGIYAQAMPNPYWDHEKQIPIGAATAYTTKDFSNLSNQAHGWGQAQAVPYDQQALELCEKCGWKTVVPGEPCLMCEKQAAAPDLSRLEPFVHGLGKVILRELQQAAGSKSIVSCLRTCD